MKIKSKEVCIEADAKELRQSNDLVNAFARMLRNAFSPMDDDDNDECEEESDVNSD